MSAKLGSGGTITAIKPAQSVNGSSTHTFAVKALETIAFYSPVYWNVAEIMLPF
jgi:hypothetical protein